MSTRTTRAPASLHAVLLASALLGVVGGCREPDPYYRHGQLADAAAGDDASVDDPDAAGPDASESCPTCPVRLLYTCRSIDSLKASFILDVTNQSTTAPIALVDLTLRYWFTRDQHAPALDCDTAKVGCTNLTTKFEDVLPPRPGANAYAEIAFTRGALSLDPGFDTGDIQLHLHAADNMAPLDAKDDYSSLCAPAVFAFPSNRITAYLGGVLVWGLEPPP